MLSLKKEFTIASLPKALWSPARAFACAALIALLVCSQAVHAMQSAQPTPAHNSDAQTATNVETEVKANLNYDILMAGTQPQYNDISTAIRTAITQAKTLNTQITAIQELKDLEKEEYRPKSLRLKTALAALDLQLNPLETRRNFYISLGSSLIAKMLEINPFATAVPNTFLAELMGEDETEYEKSKLVTRFHHALRPLTTPIKQFVNTVGTTWNSINDFVQPRRTAENVINITHSAMSAATSAPGIISRTYTRLCSINSREGAIRLVSDAGRSALSSISSMVNNQSNGTIVFSAFGALAGTRLLGHMITDPNRAALLYSVMYSCLYPAIYQYRVS